MLCRSLAGSRYFDCDLPSVRRETADPEAFLKSLGKEILVLDEIHRLDDPALLLKIAADHFPTLRIVATGSSTLGASAKFRDTLAGRKAELWLTPLCEADDAFPGILDRQRRFLNGGLPGFFWRKAAMTASMPNGWKPSGPGTSWNCSALNAGPHS
jgi:predicted AAA+ superfamily ATPase